MDKQYFELKQEHLALLNRAYVSWGTVEFGAPAINGKRPYGNSDVYGDIAEIIGVEADAEEWDPFTEEQKEHMRTLHEETETALQIALACSGDVHPGTYEAEKYKRNWRRSQQPEQGRYERMKRERNLLKAALLTIGARARGTMRRDWGMVEDEVNAVLSGEEDRAALTPRNFHSQPHK